MTKKTRVLVLGGGYAGVMAANRLSGREDIDIALVNPRPFFVQRVRLHEYVGGTDGAIVPYRDVLSDRVRLVEDLVARIDREHFRVEMAWGPPERYDFMIYAVGSCATYSGVAGADLHAYPVATLEAANELATALRSTRPGAPVVVVGGGPAGIETAAELAAQGHFVTLVCGGPLGPYLNESARAALAMQLQTLGVDIVDGPGTKVTSVQPDGVRLANGRELPAKVTAWTTGFGVPALARKSGLSTDFEGRLLTDESLRSVDDPSIIGAGDCTAPSGMPVRMSAQAALALGSHAAETVLSSIDGKPAAAIDFAVLNQCISVGRHMGIVQISNLQDRATRWFFRGRSAAAVKNFTYRHMLKTLSAEARRPGRYRTPFRDRRRPHEVARSAPVKLPSA